MTRREMREHIFCMVFLEDFYQNDLLTQQREHYLDDVSVMDADDFELRGFPFVDKDSSLSYIRDEDRKELNSRIEQIASCIEKIDEKINSIAQGWRTGRMGKVDLAIIRVACYEILYDQKVPDKVAINEAVEIAKKYGGDDSPSFVNGILAKLVK